MITEKAIPDLIKAYGPGVRVSTQALGGKGSTLTLELIKNDFKDRGAIIFDGPGEHEIIVF